MYGESLLMIHISSMHCWHVRAWSISIQRCQRRSNCLRFPYSSQPACTFSCPPPVPPGSTGAASHHPEVRLTVQVAAWDLKRPVEVLNRPTENTLLAFQMPFVRLEWLTKHLLKTCKTLKSPFKVLPKQLRKRWEQGGLEVHEEFIY